MSRISFGPGWLRTPGPDPQHKTLNRDEIREVLGLVLRSGVILLENGADSALTERALWHMARCMGCDNVEVLITATGIVVTTEEGGDFRTKARRALQTTVHMGKVAAISELAQRMTQEELSIEDVQRELDEIEQIPHYSGWLVIPAVAASCGAFSQLFDGGLLELAISFAIALPVVWVRRKLMLKHFDPILVTVICTTLGATLAIKMSQSLNAITTAIVSAACIPMIPGVHFINSARDIIKGHLVTGMARGLRATVLVFSIALGVSLAVSLEPRLP